MPPIRMSLGTMVCADVIAWGLIHTCTGYLVHRLDTSRFDHDTWLTAPRRWERSGRAYERVGIRLWKDRLPEAGALFAGGMSKKALPSSTPVGLARFATETRRAEWGHWLCALSSALFPLWNPPVICVTMVGYGAAVNAPFIAIQRYNRLRISRVLDRRSSTSTAARSAERPLE